MKRLISLFSLLTMLLSLFSCGGKQYSPVASTDEENRVLVKFNFEGETYELKYELYRALFLSHSTTYDNGDKSFWSTPESNTAKKELNDTIIALATEIFAALHLSKKIGYDPFSNDADKKIKEYIKESVEGGSVKGFDGDYEAYLAHLKSLNLNYSVQTLLFRYSIAYEKILEYYKGTADIDAPTPDMEEGALNYTEEDVKNFYFSDESARISIITFNAEYITEETVRQRRDKIASYTSLSDALNYAVQFTAGDPEDILSGAVIGKNSMDATFYSEVIKSAFSMSVGDVSHVIPISTDKKIEYWIICKMEKDAGYVETEFERIEEVYVSQKIGEIIENVRVSIESTAKETSVMENLDLSKISMD